MRDISLTVLELDGPWSWGCALSAEHSESMSDRETHATAQRRVFMGWGLRTWCVMSLILSLYADLEIRTTLRYVQCP